MRIICTVTTGSRNNTLCIEENIEPEKMP